MKKLIIFEGIASSGKTTVSNIIKEKLLKKFSVLSIDENKTLMPLIDNKDSLIAIKHLEAILKEIEDLKSDYIIIDRFLFTHMFRTESNFDSFKDIVEILTHDFDTKIFILTIPEDMIMNRIEKTQEIRGDKWKKGKQGSIEEKVKYYREQQKELLNLATTSSIESMIIGTEQQDWEKYANKIFSSISQTGSNIVQ